MVEELAILLAHELGQQRPHKARARVIIIDEKGVIERAMYNVKATGHVAKLRRELGID